MSHMAAHRLGSNHFTLLQRSNARSHQWAAGLGGGVVSLALGIPASSGPNEMTGARPLREVEVASGKAAWPA